MRYFLTLILLTISTSCFGWGSNAPSFAISQNNSPSESNLVVGFTTIGTGTVTTSSRRILITVPEGGMTASHMYMNARDAYGIATVSFSIFTTSGTLLTGCTNSFNVPLNYAWFGGALDTPTFLTAGDYYLQFTATSSIYYRATATGTGSAYGNGGCGVLCSTASDNSAALVVANYAAY